MGKHLEIASKGAKRFANPDQAAPTKLVILVEENVHYAEERRLEYYQINLSETSASSVVVGLWSGLVIKRKDSSGPV